MKRVLVCGGAGYIGSHMVKRLLRDGYDVTVFDNLSTGHREAVQQAELVHGDVLDSAALERLFSSHRFDAVMHFCALSIVSDSIRDPYAYFRNNVTGTLNLLLAMKAANVGTFIFSSTAAVYGNPTQDRISETHTTQPINPYGASKLIVERILKDAANAYGLKSVTLRYFNAAGAASEGDIGESHSPETHLLPNVLRCAQDPHNNSLRIFGTDYDTRDGTCVRDYVHVNDLTEAHLKAMRYTVDNPGAHCFNLGSGAGFSILEVVEAARRITGKKIPFIAESRRSGDPPTLVADCGLAAAELKWRPQFSDLLSIIDTAWRWHCNPRF